MALPFPPEGKQREVLALKPEGNIVVLGTAMFDHNGDSSSSLRLADQRTDHQGRTLLMNFQRSLF